MIDVKTGLYYSRLFASSFYGIYARFTLSKESSAT